MLIALAQFSPKQGDIFFNLERIVDFAKEASGKGAKLLCLPEVCTTGFPWDRKNQIPQDTDKCIKKISEIAKTNSVSISGSFLVDTDKDKPTNTFLYFESDGSISVRYSKTHLFRQFKEPEYLGSGDSIVTASTVLGRIGCSICYDLRFPELFRKCALDGAELQILPAAFPHPRQEHWRVMVQARAMENQNFIIATNQCGYEGDNAAEDGIHYCGHSMVVHPSGEILFEAGEGEELGTVNLNLLDIEKVRASMHCLNDRRPELY